MLFSSMHSSYWSVLLCCVLSTHSKTSSLYNLIYNTLLSHEYAYTYISPDSFTPLSCIYTNYISCSTPHPHYHANQLHFLPALVPLLKCLFVSDHISVSDPIVPTPTRYHESISYILLHIPIPRDFAYQL